MDVLFIASRVPQVLVSGKNDDDFSDRLNYRYTVALLLLFSVVVVTKQYGSAQSNINCWVPAHFTSVYEEYTSRICFISNTYYYEQNEGIPNEQEKRKKSEIKYYQWVSFILWSQALVFYMPRILWRSLSRRSGLDMTDLVEAAYNYKSADNFAERDKHVEYMVRNIDQYVDDSRRYDKNRPVNPIIHFFGFLIPCAGRYLGNYLVFLYFIIKIVYILNTILQMMLLSFIFGKSWFEFGLYFVKKIFTGGGWSIESKYFPKVALCDFNVREPGNIQKVHTYTVQCVLPVNLFNQQIFIVIWFWYFLVLFWNIIELIKWTNNTIKASIWVKKHIRLFEPEVGKTEFTKKRLEHFINTYLEPDGLWMLQIISSNASDFVANDLIKKLWAKHFKKYENTLIETDDIRIEHEDV